jgi:DNA-binding phage protein
MVNANRSAIATAKSHNRIAAIMTHVTRYSFRGNSRLAADSGLSKGTISRLVRGKTNPLYNTIAKVVKSLETNLGRSLSHAEVVSDDGTYPTQSVCELVGCSGCLPDLMYADDGSVQRAFQGRLPGHWSGDLAEFKPEANQESRHR